MTHSDFIKWLDEEIGMAISNEKGVRAESFVEIKEKFLTLLHPPTTLS